MARILLACWHTPPGHSLYHCSEDLSFISRRISQISDYLISQLAAAQFVRPAQSVGQRSDGRGWRRECSPSLSLHVSLWFLWFLSSPSPLSLTFHDFLGFDTWRRECSPSPSLDFFPTPNMIFYDSTPDWLSVRVFPLTADPSCTVPDLLTLKHWFVKRKV